MSDPAGQVADEAYAAGYQDGVTQGLRWARCAQSPTTETEEKA